MRNTPRFLVVCASLLAIGSTILFSGGRLGQLTPQLSAAAPQANDARLSNAWTFKRDGWTYIRLEGSPADIGYQHGTLLSAEISDAFNAIKFMDTRRTK